MTASLTIREKDLFDNPTPRVAIALVLDTSSSMLGEPIDELNSGIKMFFEEMSSNPYTAPSAEVCVVTFDSSAQCYHDFQNITNQNCPTLVANGSTSMDDGVNLALDKLEQTKQDYKDSGISYYQPWMVLMTDGAPTQDISHSTRRTTDLINQKKLTIFPIGIGSEADMNVLSQYSPLRDPLQLKGLKFANFFEWLSESASRVSQSTPGDVVELNTDIKGWAEL